MRAALPIAGKAAASPRRTPPRRALRALTLVLIAATSACGSTNTVPPLFDSLELPITVTELRLRVNDFAEFAVLALEDSIEVIIDVSEDQEVRRSAMIFRLRAVNSFLNAMSQPELTASLIDAWAFSLQLHDFVTTGEASDLFGDQQNIAVAATRMIAAEAEQVVIAVAQADPVLGREMITRWATEHPLRIHMARQTSATLLAEQLERRDDSVFATLGQLQTGVDEISSQLRLYISIMPRTIRWQTQLILHEMLYDEPRIRGMLDNFDLLTANLLEMSSLLDELPEIDELTAEARTALEELSAELGPLLEVERRRAVAEMDRQRQLVFEDVTAQRLAIMVDIEQQIDEIDAQIEGQLDEVFRRIEALTAATVDDSFAESERLLDLIFLRVLGLMLVAIVGGAFLVVLRKR